MRILLAACITFFLLLPPVLAADACAPNATKHYRPVEEYYTHGLLFKIDKCGIPASYLFGTLHSDDPKYNSLLDRIAPTIVAAERAYFEIPSDKATQAKAMDYLFLPAGGSLRSLAGEALFNKASTAMLKKGVPAELTNRLTPWAVAVLLQIPPDKADGKVIDEKLQSLFQGQGKPVAGLEALDAHFGTFIGLPLAKQLVLLQEVVDDTSENDKAVVEMETAYANQDLRTIDRLGDEAFAEIGDVELRAYMEAKILNDRNRAMAEMLKPLLPQGGLFVAVGAMHLPGQNGLIHLLEQQGYFISPVPVP